MVVSPNDPRINQVGFAKLLGDGIEVNAKKYEIVIGRHSKSSIVDVVLGTPGLSLHSQGGCPELLQTSICVPLLDKLQGTDRVCCAEILWLC